MLSWGGKQRQIVLEHLTLSFVEGAVGCCPFLHAHPGHLWFWSVHSIAPSTEASNAMRMTTP